ncbi:MAG: hypothetical protein GF315_00210 [candidate division Zixibacteria bacterium]|nr:hypothetical protein [candidate division Zixibacteria bacterium]
MTFDTELKKIIRISKEFGAKKVILFGSYFRDADSAHDIDIAVSGIDPKRFFKYYGKVSMVVGPEVDIIDLDDIRQHLRKRILSRGEVLYERAV